MNGEMETAAQDKGYILFEKKIHIFLLIIQLLEFQWMILFQTDILASVLV